MSAHHLNRINGVSLDYFRNILQWPQKTCYKCHTAMIPVWVRYLPKPRNENDKRPQYVSKDNPIHQEWECIECEKIIRDSRFKNHSKNTNKRNY